MSTDSKKSKRKRGRPKLPKHEARSIIIQVRVNDEEMNRILREVGNRTVTDWAREKLGL
jgi:hypothetical protein